jgi:type IX secretion system substrate protein
VVSKLFINQKKYIMKRVLLLSATFFMFVFASFSQVIYEDNFDAYTTGGYLAEQSADWTTWSGAPATAEDAFISDEQAMTVPNSVKVDGTTDLVKPLGDLTSGNFELSFNIYVPANFAGYYNIQHFEQPGIEWALEVYFDDDGTGYISAGGANAATFTYTPDTWVPVVHNIDVTNDLAELYIEGTFVHSWQFSLQADGTAGTKQLGGVNHFAGATTGMTATYYFDDYSFKRMPTILFFDDFESYNVGDYLAETSGWWTTWGGTVGTTEDALITDVEAFSPTQSAAIEGVSDLIGPFGDKISGAYEVNFYYFVPSGFGGYYNIQHFETPGIEWAYEVYFGEIGEGYLTVSGENHYFDFTPGQWIYIENDIDLDNDLTSVYVDGALVFEFPFSNTANDPGTGELQLGGIDIFAGAITGETPMFYVDDFEWAELSGPTDPEIVVDPTSMMAAIEPNMTEDQALTIENIGAADLTFDIDIVYQFDGDQVRTPNTGANSKTKTVKLDIREMPKTGVTVPTPAKDDITLKYCGDYFSAVGLNNPSIWEVAARFPNEMIVQYAGMELTQVDVFVQDLTDNFQARVYGEGPNNQAGDLLSSKIFSPVSTDWTSITLDDPVKVTGEDLWVGYMIDQGEGGIFPAGTDEGPANPNGDFIKSGVAWSHLASNPDLNYNWLIVGTLTGEAMPNWLSVSPEMGTVAAGASEELTVTFDATGLAIGVYRANMEVNSNDPATAMVTVDATLDVATGVNEIGENNAILVFPNPAADYVQVQANHDITNIRMVNCIGQVVYVNNNPNKLVTIITNTLKAGVYFVQIETTAGSVNKQIIVQ